MMLVSKPSAFPTPAVTHVHRRHPSAPPPVVVHPTKTPGLLAVSKPVRVTPQRPLPSQQRSAKSPKQSKQQQQVARAPAPLTPAEITNKKPALVALQTVASPSPQNRGRGQKHGRERQQGKRTTTQSPVRAKHARQPSPPVPTEPQPQSPIQAERTCSNQFDPFLAAQTTPPPRRQPPTLAHPQPHVPQASFMPPPRTYTFPICEDTEDLSGPDSAGVPTPPATPLRKRAFGDKTYLVNAPINVNAYPFTYPSPPPSNKSRKHRRNPSDGPTYHMSSDEDGPVPFPYPSKAPLTPPSSLSRATGTSASGSLKTATYFASSLFQNSPSPDELPDPLLF